MCVWLRGRTAQAGSRGDITDTAQSGCCDDLNETGGGMFDLSTVLQVATDLRSGNSENTFGMSIPIELCIGCVCLCKNMVTLTVLQY